MTDFETLRPGCRGDGFPVRSDLSMKPINPSERNGYTEDRHGQR